MKFTSFVFATIFAIAAASVSKAQPVETITAFKRGDTLVAQEKYRAAIEEYGRISRQSGESYARAIYNIGVCHYELWKTDDAISFYKRAIELKQGNYPRASYALGVALEDQGKLTEAKLAYEQAIKVSHNEFALATYKLGVLEARAGEFRKAASLFRDAASRDGKHAAASHNNLGVMLAQLGFLKEAEAEFLIALRESKDTLADAVHNLTLCRSLKTSSKGVGIEKLRLV